MAPHGIREGESMKADDRVRFEVLKVTPALATKWLEGNVINREIRQKHVNKLARQFRDGKGRLTNNAVAFDGGEPPRLLDGQHRLWAIIESGVAVTMLVGWGFEGAEMQAIIDTGLTRTGRDTAKISGHPDATNRQISVARCMMRYGSGYNISMTSNQDIVAYYGKVKAAIIFALNDVLRVGDKCPPGYSQAGLVAVIAQAYHSRPADRLVEFGDILRSGNRRGHPGSEAVLLMREYLIRPVGLVTQHGVYRRTQTALDAFLRNEQLPELYETREQRFPLPDGLSAPVRGRK